MASTLAHLAQAATIGIEWAPGRFADVWRVAPPLAALTPGAGRARVRAAVAAAAERRAVGAHERRPVRGERRSGVGAGRRAPAGRRVAELERLLRAVRDVRDGARAGRRAVAAPARGVAARRGDRRLGLRGRSPARRVRHHVRSLDSGLAHQSCLHSPLHRTRGGVSRGACAALIRRSRRAARSSSPDSRRTSNSSTPTVLRCAGRTATAACAPTISARSRSTVRRVAVPSSCSRTSGDTLREVQGGVDLLPGIAFGLTLGEQLPGAHDAMLLALERGAPAAWTSERLAFPRVGPERPGRRSRPPRARRAR